MRQKRVISIGLAAFMLVSLCAVSATTGVTAATTSGGAQASSSQAKLTDVVGAPPGGLASAPAVCSWGPERLDVFALGGGAPPVPQLWHKWWDGTWHSWEDLGGLPINSQTDFVSAPTAVSWSAGRIDLFARVSPGNLWHKWFDQGWHNWENLGTPTSASIQVFTAPAASSWGPSRLDIFVTGSDGQLWQKWFGNGDWQAWVPLGKPSAGLDGSPGALSTVSWGYPRIDIFVRGADGALWQLWWKNGWQAWHRFDETAGIIARNSVFYAEDYAPAVCSWGANRLDVFFVDTSGLLQQKWFDNGWKLLYNVGGTQALTASPSAVTWQLGITTRIDIFARGADFALWQMWWAGGWSGWYNLGLLY